MVQPRFHVAGTNLLAKPPFNAKLVEIKFRNSNILSKDYKTNIQSLFPASTQKVQRYLYNNINQTLPSFLFRS